MVKKFNDGKKKKILFRRPRGVASEEEERISFFRILFNLTIAAHVAYRSLLEDRYDRRQALTDNLNLRQEIRREGRKARLRPSRIQALVNPLNSEIVKRELGSLFGLGRRSSKASSYARLCYEFLYGYGRISAEKFLELQGSLAPPSDPSFLRNAGSDFWDPDNRRGGDGGAAGGIAA